MLPTSIATRVTLAFGALLAVALLLLSVAVLVAHDVRQTNTRISLLDRLLLQEDLRDQSQRELRLALGDATRLAEQGRSVPEPRWRALLARIDAFQAISQAAPAFRDPRLPASARGALARTRQAAEAFASSSRRLVTVATARPANIEGEMPGFLGALKRLETHRTETRRALTREIDAAATENIRRSYHNLLAVIAGGFGVVAILLALILWLRRQVISPIVLIAERLRELASGAGSGVHVPELQRRDELGELARGLADYREAVEQRRSAERRADFLAHHDMLTGLPNRLLFESRLAHELARSQRTGNRVAVFAVDLDEFKAINDRHGHAGGDAALRRVAQLLSDCVRSDDLVARLGGDEFAIIQVSGDQPRSAELLLSRLFQAASATAADAVPVRMSVGVAISTDERDADELYDRADTAMYRAKLDGRNTARFFDTGLKNEVRLRWRLGRDLATAIENGELRVVYQPIADAGTLRVDAYEALLRWEHPELGAIRPDSFVPVAEANGLIEPIGRWMADQALAAAARWPEPVGLSLNLSPVQFRNRDLAEDLLSLARRHGVAPERLEFEVTESAVLLGSRRDDVLATLHALQARGAQIVMDDFGTGHSSLGNLRDFRFDKLKVDCSFVMALPGDVLSALIVKTVIGLGSSMGIPVVAEGVETEEQLRLLRGWGCAQVQGYRIGKPAPVTDVVLQRALTAR